MHCPRSLSESVVKRPRAKLHESWCPIWIITYISSRYLIPSWISQGWPRPHLGLPSPDSLDISQITSSIRTFCNGKGALYLHCPVATCAYQAFEMGLLLLGSGGRQLGESEVSTSRAYLPFNFNRKEEPRAFVWIASTAAVSQLMFW